MRTQDAVSARLTDSSLAGHWRIFTRHRHGQIRELTDFRGALTEVEEMTFEDPGGPKEMTLNFPAVTFYDRYGYDDLFWLNKHTSIDVVWTGSLPAAYPFGRKMGNRHHPTWHPSFSWEGYIDDFTPGRTGAAVKLKGALYQLNNYLAVPEYLRRPLPYEHAIARQFHDKPHLRVGRLLVQWPDDWAKTYTPPPKDTPGYLVPTGLHRGDNWTGLVTRSTGTWDPVLDSYITTMLQSMYTRHGRWTLDLLRGRIPVLTHRLMRARPGADSVQLDLANDAAIEVQQLEIDWSQSVDVAYGQGTALTGVAFSGMEVTNDGERTYYVPMANTRQAYPTEDNEWRDLASMPTEVNLEFPQGIDQYQAEQVARAHIERFGDPGITGSLDLVGDVKLHDGSVLPYPLVRAGMTAHLRNLLGLPEGVMAHITSNTVNLKEGRNSLTFDTKWRDALTVAEVRIKGRDAMNISRMLVAGQYTPPIPDQLLPWNYAEGSGVIPYHPDTVGFFDSMPKDLRFPWTHWTTNHPPHKPRWRDAYIRIGPARHNVDKNWAGTPHHSGGRAFAIPVRMAQAGQIRLLQLAAYDADGHVLAVPFHVSFYYMKNTSVMAMPKIRVTDTADPDQPFVADQAGEHSPWVKDAWEEYNTDGTLKSTDVPQAVRSAGLWKAYGNLTIKAGFFPGDGAGEDPPTGLLVDETVQSFDTTHYGQFDQYAPKANRKNTDAGMLYAMIYCDQQSTDPVYFLGRMFRVEPGSNPGGS